MRSETLTLTEDKFLHTLSHDLREPARLISQFLKLVKLKTGDGLDGDAEMYLDYAITASDKMDNMIKGLSEINSVKGVSGDKSVVEMTTLIKELKEKMERLHAGRDFILRYEGEQTFHMRKEVVKEVLKELVTNAFLHSEKEDCLEVTIQMENKGDQLIIVVKNSGSSDIDPFWYENVFEPFKKKDKESKNLGVGLTRLKMLTTRFGGKMDFKVDGDFTYVTCKVN